MIQINRYKIIVFLLLSSQFAIASSIATNNTIFNKKYTPLEINFLTICIHNTQPSKKSTLVTGNSTNSPTYFMLQTKKTPGSI